MREGALIASASCSTHRFPWRLSPPEQLLQGPENADHNRSCVADGGEQDWSSPGASRKKVCFLFMSGTCRLEQLLLMKRPTHCKVLTGRAKTSRMSGRSADKGNDAHNGRLIGSRDRRRYACLKCPYATDRRDLFTRHENIHRDEKPFRCYVCNKMFNRADHVKKHFLRIHKGLEYDVKLTKRIRGVDYVDAENLPNEPMSDATSGKDISLLTSDPPTASTATIHFSSHLVNRLIEANHLLNSTKSSHPVCPSAFDAKSQLVQFHDVSRSDNPPVTPSPFAPFDGDSKSKRHGAETVPSQSDRRVIACEKDADRVSVDADLLDAGRDPISETRDDETSTLSSPSPTQSMSSRCSLHELPSKCTIFPGSRSIERISRGLVIKQTNDERGNLAVASPQMMMMKGMSTLSAKSNSHLSHEYECHVCGCAFADFPSLHTHRYLLHRFVPCSKHTHVSQYLCASCGLYLPNQKSMMQHMNKHYARATADHELHEEEEYNDRICVTSNRRKQVLPRKVVKSDPPVLTSNQKPV